MSRLLLALSLGLATWLVAHSPARAEPKVERTVNCVYPAESLAGALTDLAAQLGYTFVPGDFADGFELDELIWVHARGVSPEAAAALIGASGGVRVGVDHANRSVTVASIDDAQPAAAVVRMFRVDAVTHRFVAYQKRYGAKLAAGATPEMFYQPTATQELQGAITEILQLEGAPGSAVGKRLLYTRPEADLTRISELIALLDSPHGGESQALALDRDYRRRLAAAKSDFRGEEMSVSAMLWQLFKDVDFPVFIDNGLMQSLDFEFDTTNVGLTRERNHHEALLALAQEQDFAIDHRLGALRLHDEGYAGAAGYQVFEVGVLLAELEQEYAALKTAEELQDGFNGDLRSEGGVQVIVEALALQLENSGHAPLIRAYGSRIAVVGGVDVIDHAREVLEAIGWKSQPSEEKK